MDKFHTMQPLCELTQRKVILMPVPEATTAHIITVMTDAVARKEAPYHRVSNIRFELLNA